MDDRIERSIDIDAPLERVWELVTVPGWWVPDPSNEVGDRTPGAVTVRSTDKWGTFPVQVVDLRPRSYAAFRWASQFAGEDLAPGRTTLIEFTLDDLGDRVHVQVVESGFAALDAPDEVKQAGLKSNTDGWTEELKSLRDRAAAA